MFQFQANNPNPTPRGQGKVNSDARRKFDPNNRNLNSCAPAIPTSLANSNPIVHSNVNGDLDATPLRATRTPSRFAKYDTLSAIQRQSNSNAPPLREFVRQSPIPTSLAIRTPHGSRNLDVAVAIVRSLGCACQ